MSDPQPSARTFPFRFSAVYRAAAAVFGVTPSRAAVSVGDGWLRARFGPWKVATPLANIAGMEMSGPYSLLKTVGPAHLSLGDRGLTFATNPTRGLCIRFLQPIAGLEPLGRIRHPALTVTVDDVHGLQGTIEQERAAGRGGR